MAAMENPRILAYCINAAEFPELASRYQVRSVPLTIIEAKTEVAFTGLHPEERFLGELFKALGL